MRKSYIAAIACAVALTATACAKTEDDDNVTADTAVVPGTETVDVPTTVPTQDTVVQKTTVETDTIEGDAKKDTIR